MAAGRRCSVGAKYRACQVSHLSECLSFMLHLARPRLHGSLRNGSTSFSLLRCSFLLLSAFSTIPHPARCQAVEERTLKLLQPNELASLVSALDPSKNLDPSNPASHLSHILIPRPGKVYFPSWYSSLAHPKNAPQLVVRISQLYESTSSPH